MSSISVQDFANHFQDDSVVILDTRDQTSFHEFHLDNALSMPATSVPNHFNELDKTKAYFVLSHSGRRSEILANFLTAHGYNAVHVIGGMRAYRQAFLHVA